MADVIENNYFAVQFRHTEEVGSWKQVGGERSSENEARKYIRKEQTIWRDYEFRVVKVYTKTTPLS